MTSLEEFKSVFTPKQQKVLDNMAFEISCLEADNFLGLEKKGAPFDILCKVRRIDMYSTYVQLSKEYGHIVCPSVVPARRPLMDYLGDLYGGFQPGVDDAPERYTDEELDAGMNGEANV